MGRVKLKIRKLQNFNARQATFGKRKNGLMKKAKELSILCDIFLLLLMFCPSGKPYLFTGKHCIEQVIDKFARLTSQERAKRKVENLEALKKTFLKIGENINISEFLDRCSLKHYQESKLEILREEAMFLRAKLSEIQTRLSYWTNLENIHSVGYLQKRENSLRQSLAQIRAHKENMLQHQQQQFRSFECKNKNVIETDFGTETENFSSLRTNENMNVPLQEEDLSLQLQQTNRDITCSASLSCGSYTGHFGKSSTISGKELEAYSIPRSFSDPYHQFNNLNCLNDPKLQQPVEWNSLASPADCYFSQIIETFYRHNFGENDWSSSEMLPYRVSVLDDPPFSMVRDLNFGAKKICKVTTPLDHMSSAYSKTEK